MMPPGRPEGYSPVSVPVIYRALVAVCAAHRGDLVGATTRRLAAAAVSMILPGSRRPTDRPAAGRARPLPHDPAELGPGRQCVHPRHPIDMEATGGLAVDHTELVGPGLDVCTCPISVRPVVSVLYAVSATTTTTTTIVVDLCCCRQPRRHQRR